MDLKEVLLKRRSIRKYKDEIINDELIEEIIKSAFLSPSGHNANPCELIIIRDKEKLKELSKARAAARMLENADTAIVVIGDTLKSTTVIEDSAIIMENMQLMTTNLGLGSCYIQIRMRETEDKQSSEEYVKQLLYIPNNYIVEAILSIGIPNEEKEIKDITNYKDRCHYNKF